MVMDIPYNFRGGTSAKAGEVNENFQAVKQYVNNMEINLAEAEATVFLLRDSKADVNGSATQVFNVANGVADTAAVNNSSLRNKIDNSIEMVRGLKLQKVNDTTVQVTVGSCYSSNDNYQHILKANENITAIVPLDQGEIVNLFIHGNDTIGDVIVGPGVVTTHPYYRFIGYAIVQNGIVTQVINYNSSATGGFIGNTILTATQGRFTLGQNRWLYIENVANGDTVEVKVGNERVCYQTTIGSQLIPCKNGQTITITTTGNPTLNWKAMV